MDSQLEDCLLEALEGVDPFELIAQDPDLNTIVQDFFQDLPEEENAPLHSPTSSDPASPSSNASSDSASSDHLITLQSVMKKQDCKLCYRKARGFRYYGVIVCNSCRAFFARSIKNDIYQRFVCQNKTIGGGKCTADLRNNNCQKCRFEHCLKAGMEIPKKHKELTNVETFDSFRRRVLKVVLRRTVLNRTKMLLRPSSMLTLEEKANVQRELKFHMNISMGSMFKLMRGDLNLFRGFLEFIYHGNVYTLRDQKKYDDYMLFSNREAYMKTTTLPAWETISHKDRLRLASGNIPLISLYLMATRLGKNIDYDREVLGYSDLLKGGADQQTCDKVDQILAEVSQNGTLTPRPVMTSESLCRSEVCDVAPEAPDRYRNAYHRMSQERLCPSPGDWDPIACVLVASVMMYTPDFLDLDEPKKVADIQSAYACLLHKYVSNLILRPLCTM